MNTYRRFGAFSSSEDPEKLGSTIRAVILGVGVLIIFLVQQIFGITWTIDNVQELATSAGGLVSAIWLAYGLVKKTAIWLILAWNNRPR